MQTRHFYNKDGLLMAVREWSQMRVPDLYHNEDP